jgi:hypothetical protein
MVTQIVQEVVGGVVVNTLLVDAAATLSGGVLSLPGGATMSPPTGSSFMIQPGAGIGWTLSGGALIAPAAPTLPAPTTAQLLAYANAKQWTLATGGHNVTIEGTSYLFATDPTSLALITGNALRLQQSGAPTSVLWQFSSTGAFVTISAADFLTTADNIADWVQSTFAALETVMAAITAATITTEAAIDAAAWPAP